MREKNSIDNRHTIERLSILFSKISKYRTIMLNRVHLPSLGEIYFDCLQNNQYYYLYNYVVVLHIVQYHQH